MRILIVDDAPANRLVLEKLLRHAGYAVSAADGPAAAERLFAEERPEVILTDLHMPSAGEGVELARRLRLQAAHPFRLALMTADAAESVAERGLFDAILPKPVTLESIRTFIGERA